MMRMSDNVTINRKPTRGAQGAGSIRKRKDGRWEARYTVGRDLGTGKQVQKSVYGATQAEVRKKLAEVTISIDEGIYTEPSKFTVKIWLEIWLEEYIKNSVKPSTYYSYSKQSRNHIIRALGATKLSTLNAHTIQKFYNDLQKSKEDGGFELSAKTVKNIHGIFHKALKQAVVLGYLKFNPSEACTLPRMTKKEIKPLEEREIVAFIEAMSGHALENVYLVTLFTGMRQGEVLGLTWDCVDFDKGTIFVNKQLLKDKNTGKYHLDTVKNDKARTITPAPFVMTALRKQEALQSSHKLTAGQAWGGSGDSNDSNDSIFVGGVGDSLVFTNELGEHLKHVTVYKNFKRIMNTLGFADTRFHDLRHTYAVAALQSGDDVKTVQENLGHHTAAFTLDVYGHVSERMRAESANRMEGFIRGLKVLDKAK